MTTDFDRYISEVTTNAVSSADDKKMTFQALEEAVKVLNPSERQMPFMGVDLKIIPDDLCTANEHIGHWLNGYNGSRHRSKRITKKLLFGTRKKAGIITKMIEKRTYVYMFDSSVFGVMHYGFGKPSVIIPKSAAVVAGLTTAG